MKLLSRGFTLLELMVVVGIIGILSAVAVPAFKKYKIRAWKAEGKISMAAIFTTEKSFFGEYATYATCLSAGGFNPGPDNTRLYTIGFYTQTPDTTWGNKSVNLVVPCAYGGLAVQNIDYFQGTKLLPYYNGTNPCTAGGIFTDCLWAVSTAAGGNCEVTSNSAFLACGAAVFSTQVGPAWDLTGVTINQDKKIQEWTAPGWIP
jgi:prepilin-type N-terminal cleavage/methylation domain-containing protein